ncbi:hypothetical protein [endosymbiont GvMRE of Glomus versiforme]|uniref:hypothetical protein n=1 Tax=endosymbiont GvMRE of Glomus versiforme TaxID=2039283 RepID=UPI000ECEA031|nr:hypothetical protein [endosymbiont GvMRE of Glomus versiforme]RHZ36388.1 hypothetical protein GvMRE_Ic1g86 [endosymbiont GvMRE of Glomus versiforme]
MPNIENQTNLKSKYIDRESYEWTREQGSKRNKEAFVNATVVIAAVAIYATWAWMIIQKIKA